MNRFSNTLIILIIIPLFIFVGLACCCFEGTAEASEPVPSCHNVENSSQDDASQSADDCDCMYKDNFLTQTNLSAVQFAAATFTNLKNLSLSQGIIGQISISSSRILSTQGPPKASAYSVPLYIQNSNLQL